MLTKIKPAMTNPDKTSFIKVTATDKEERTVELLVHKDRILYIIGQDVYLKGENTHVIRTLRMGDIELNNFKLPEKGDTFGILPAV